MELRAVCGSGWMAGRRWSSRRSDPERLASAQHPYVRHTLSLSMSLSRHVVYHSNPASMCGRCSAARERGAVCQPGEVCVKVYK